MKNTKFRHHNRRLLEKIDEVITDTVIHKRPFSVHSGVWHFVVVGPDAKGTTAIRTGTAEQARIRQAPVYIATLAGPHIADEGGVAIEDLAGGDIPPELAGLKIHDISPLRPLSITARRSGPPLSAAIDEVLDFYRGNETAVIETPDEAYWALSVLKYLEEADHIFPDPVLSRFYSRLGRGGGLAH